MRANDSAKKQGLPRWAWWVWAASFIGYFIGAVAFTPSMPVRRLVSSEAQATVVPSASNGVTVIQQPMDWEWCMRDAECRESVLNIYRIAAMPLYPLVVVNAERM